MPAIVDAVLVLDGHPARDLRDAREVLRRCAVEQRDGYATPEPVDLDAGMWLVQVTPVLLHNLQVDGEIDRHFGPANFYATWSD